jgi:Tol biopolymer transport system component
VPGAYRFALCTIHADGRGRRVVARGVLGPPHGPAAAWSPRRLRLAYVSRDGIFVVNADGRARRRVARKETAISVSSLGWSADGRRLVFAETIDFNDSEIYTAAADGSSVQALTRNEVSDFQPAWAPDGGRVAFVRNRDYAFDEIWVMNAEGSGQRLVARDGFEPSWTADGSSIVFTRAAAAPLGNVAYSIHSVSVSSGREQLLVSVGFGGAPSPDGKKLAFTRGGAVFLAAPDGSAQMLLTPGTGTLSWSPDSTTLAFGRCTPGAAVCTIRIDGSDSTPVVQVSEPPTVDSLSFSPDGTALAFSFRPDEATSQIEVSGLDGTGRRVLTTAPGLSGNVDWQPLPR